MGNIYRKATMWMLAFLVVAALQAGLSEGISHRRVCYYSGWAMYRPAPYDVLPGDLNPSLCTHLLFAFATLDDNGTQLVVEDPNEQPLYHSFTNLKYKNPALKTMIAVGGWNMGSKLFIRLVHSESNMRLFAVNAITFLRHNRFDGLDIDWEYPAARGSKA